MNTANIKTPWNKIYEQLGINEPSEYFKGTLYEGIKNSADSYPNQIALKFMGRSISYKCLLNTIQRVAKGLSAIGIKENDAVIIALPNCPQAVYMFYAVNLIGGIAVMVHPLSAEKELEFYIQSSHAVAAITLDQFYPKYKNLIHDEMLKTLIITGITDELSFAMRIGYRFTEGRKTSKIPSNTSIVFWKKMIFAGKDTLFKAPKRNADDTAAILFSGGTTGCSKGVCLTSFNFNAYREIKNSFLPTFCPGDSILAAMPMFHGFGLACISIFLLCGGKCILIPRFTPESYYKDIIKNKSNFIVGVPTLFEAMLKIPKTRKADFSFIKEVLCGGDSLSFDLRERLSEFFKAHHASVEVREGYGASEMIAGCCLSPIGNYKKGSIGIPLRGIYMKIVQPGTDIELPYCETGEIVVSGPTVMKGYINRPDENAVTLRKHADGLTWLYTGDLGMMDEAGYFYFKGRLKRMIITSGYNVYPDQLENIIEQCPLVQMCCVIGVPDAYKMQRVKAFIVLKYNVKKSVEVKDEIIVYCQKRIAKYAMPKEIEFRDELPKTLVGKIDYRQLEEQESNYDSNFPHQKMRRSKKT